MKNCNERKIGKRIFGLMSSEEGGAFFRQRVLRKCTDAKRQKKKRIGETFSKVGCQVLLSKEVVLGHPCIPRVRVNKGGDKRPSLRKKGRSWYRGEGGGAGQIQGVKG